MIILLSGKMGSGKTTTADQLALTFEAQGYEVFRTRFAVVLYEMHDAVLNVIKSYGVIPPKKKYGELLQYLGTEFGRKQFGPDVWVECLQRVVGERAFSSKYVVIIDDMRFKNEFKAFPEGFRVRLECDREIRKARCNSWRENENHRSEVDLDKWLKKFDLVLDTGRLPVSLVVSAITGMALTRKFHKESTDGAVFTGIGVDAGGDVLTEGLEKSMATEV